MADQKPISKGGSKANTPPEPVQEGSPAPATETSSASGTEAAAKTEQTKPQASEAGSANQSVGKEATAAMSKNPCSCQSEETSSDFDCNPCSDPIATANRVIRDPNVSSAVSELLGAAARSVKDDGSARVPKMVHGALEGIARAFAGKDAVPAKGEICGGAGSGVLRNPESGHRRTNAARCPACAQDRAPAP